MPFHEKAERHLEAPIKQLWSISKAIETNCTDDKSEAKPTPLCRNILETNNTSKISKRLALTRSARFQLHVVISNDSGQHDLHVSYVCLHERNSMAIASGTLEITTYLQIDKRNAERSVWKCWGLFHKLMKILWIHNQLSLRLANCPSEDQVLVFKVGTLSKGNCWSAANALRIKNRKANKIAL